MMNAAKIFLAILIIVTINTAFGATDISMTSALKSKLDFDSNSSKVYIVQSKDAIQGSAEWRNRSDWMVGKFD